MRTVKITEYPISSLDILQLAHLKRHLLIDVLFTESDTCKTRVPTKWNYAWQDYVEVTQMNARLDTFYKYHEYLPNELVFNEVYNLLDSIPTSYEEWLVFEQNLLYKIGIAWGKYNV